MFPPELYITPVEVLHGHVDFLSQKQDKKSPPINPVIMHGYPFGMSLKCPMRAYLEVTDNPANLKRGKAMRYVTQTPFKDYCVLYSDWIQQFGLNGAIDLEKKNPPIRWNKPNCSTYFLWGCMYTAEYMDIPLPNQKSPGHGKAGKTCTEYFAFTMSTPLYSLYNFLKFVSKVSSVSFIPSPQGTLLHKAIDFVMAVSGGSLSRRISGWTADTGFSGFRTEADHFLHLLASVPGSISRNVVDAIVVPPVRP